MEDFYAKEIGGTQATAEPAGQEDFYSKEIGGGNSGAGIDYSSLKQGGGGSGEQKAPINLGEAYNIGSIRTPEYKAKYVQQLFPGAQVSLDQDKRIKVTSASGDSYIEPHRNGFVNWLKDNSTKLAEFAGDQTLPILGQMGADALAVGAAPETGGASMMGLTAANAAGAGAGRLAQQAYNKELVGEPFSGGDVAMQGAAGGASVPIAAAVGPAIRETSKILAKGIHGAIDKLGGAFPNIAESLLGVPHMNSEWLIDQTRKGRSVSEIFGRDLENANSERGGQIVRNVLFGDKDSKGLPEDFIKHYQSLIKPISGDAGKVGVLDSFFAKNLGLDKDTLDVLKTRSLSDLMSSDVTDPKAWRLLADKAIGAAERGTTAIQEEYSKVLKTVIDNTKDQYVNIKPLVDELAKGAEELRITDGLTMNKNYVGDAGKKAYETFLNKFGQIMSRDSKIAPVGGKSGGRTAGKKFTTGDLMDLLNSGIEATVNGKKVKLTPFDMTRMKVSDIRNLKAETKPFFNKLFEGTGLSQAEKRPLAQFLNGLDNALDTLPGAEPLKAMNQKYAQFQDAKDLFHTLGYGNLQEQQGVISTLKQSLSKDPAGRATSQSYLADLDNMLGSKILPELKTLGASQDVRAIDFDKSEKSLLGQMRSIHQSGASQDTQRLGADILKTVDNAIPKRASKFYNDVRDHLTAEAFNSNRQNVFKVRYLETLLGASALTAGHPVLGAAGVLAGLNLLSPQGVGKGLIAGEKIVGELAKGAPTIARGASKDAMSSQGKAALATILRHKKS